MGTLLIIFQNYTLQYKPDQIVINEIDFVVNVISKSEELRYI